MCHHDLSFILWLSQEFCHSYRKLINTTINLKLMQDVLVLMYKTAGWKGDFLLYSPLHFLKFQQ
jgi:hypothetical protein